MANIKVISSVPAYHGQQLTFKSPAACSAATELMVAWTEGETESTKNFKFADAHGQNVGGKDLFGANVLVKVILDMEANKAYVQNADTNAYLEGKFSELNNPEFRKASSLVELVSKESIDKMLGKIAKAVSDLISHLSNKSNPHGVTASQVGAVANTGDTMTGALSVKHKDGVNTFRPAADMNSGLPEHKNQLSIVANGNSVLNRWKWDSANSKYAHQSAFYFGDKALQLYNASEGKTYEFYGSHNTSALATQIQTLLQGGNVSMVKSVQRGFVQGGKSTVKELSKLSGGKTDANNYSFYVDITISSVNTSKSQVMIKGFNIGSSNFNYIWKFIGNNKVRIYVSEAAHESSTTANYNGFIWEITEFY